MKKIYVCSLILFAFVLMSACRSNNQTQFNVKISIEGLKEAKVVIEELDINKVYLVDATHTDSVGICTLKGKYGKPNLYRVSVADLGQLYIVIDQNQLEININPDDFYNYTVKGSARSSQLQQFIKQVNEYNKDWAKQSLVMHTSATTDTSSLSTEAATLTASAKQAQLYQFIKTNADTVSFMPLAIMYANFLPMEQEAAYLNRFLKTLPTRFPDQTAAISNYQKVFFNSYNWYVNEQKIVKDTAQHQTILHKKINDFSAKDVDGTVFQLNQFKDKYVVIQFVGSWNENSTYWNKQMQQAFTQLKSYPVQFLSVYVEDDAIEWEAVVSKDQLPWPQISNLNSWSCPILQQFHVVTIPTTIILNPAKEVIGVDWTIAQIVEDIKANSAPISIPTDSLANIQSLAAR